VLRIRGIAVIVRDQLFVVGFAVVVGVAHEPEIRRLCDQHAIGDECEGAREDQSARELGALVHAAIVVRVFERGDRADGRVFADAVHIGHVSAHLDDPHSAIGRDADGYRVEQQRIARDNLDLEAGRDAQRFQCSFRTQWWRGRGLDVFRRRLLLFTRPVAALRLRVPGRNQRQT
jgi:hypothetical protein